MAHRAEGGTDEDRFPVRPARRSSAVAAASAWARRSSCWSPAPSSPSPGVVRPLLDDAREQLASRTGAGAALLRVVASDPRDADEVDTALTAAADDEGQLAAIFVPAGGTED